MKTLLVPAGARTHRYTAVGTVALLVASASSILVAHQAMPESYSWISNTISESAAQGLRNAWIARLGFLLFGLAVVWLALALRSTWARSAYRMHMAFGLCMVSTAAFSHEPWLENVPVDRVEDFLHSVTATGMGFAFCFGVLARRCQRGASQSARRTFDATALLAATAMPLLMAGWPDGGGLVQRLMFLVAYAWYGSETRAIAGPRGDVSRGS